MLNMIKIFVFVFCLSHGIPAVLPSESRSLAYEIFGMIQAILVLMITGEFILRSIWYVHTTGDIIGKTLDKIAGFYLGIFDEVLPGERARWRARWVDRLNVLGQRQEIYRKLLMSEGEKAEYRFVMFSNVIFASGLMLSFFIGIMAYIQRDLGMEFDSAGLNFAGVLTLVSTVYGFILLARFYRAMDRKYRTVYESRFEEVTIDNATFIRERETAAAGA